MNLFLGIYSKKSELKSFEINSIINDFSFNRIENIKTINTKNFHISCYSNNQNKHSFNLTQRNNIIIAVSGHILNNKAFNIKHPNLSSNYSEYILDLYNAESEIDYSSIDGEFAISIYDGNNDTLTIANNLFGTFPLFYYSDNDYVMFCNEYEPITKYLKFDKKICKTTIVEFLVLGSPINGKTLFNSIENLNPATQIKFKGSSAIEYCYTNSNILIDYKLTTSEIANKFSTLFTDTIKKRSEISEPKYCSLSGGLDTRLILSAMSNEDRKQTIFASLLSEPLDETNDRDVIIAKQIALELKLNHLIVPMSKWWNVWSKDFDKNYFTDLRYPQMPYIFSGHYGSELIKGEFTQLVPMFIQDMLSLNNDISFDLIKNKLYKSENLNSIFKSEIYHTNLKEYLHQVIENLFGELKTYNCENKLLLFAINQMTRSFFSTMYSGSFGSWLMTYRFPIGWNLPFIDKNILELLLSVPIDKLTDKKQNLYNKIYKNNFPELIHIPTSSYFGSVNGNCIKFYNNGFEPKNVHIAKYEKAFEKLIKDDRINELKIFNFKKLKKLKTQGNKIELRPPIEFAMWLTHLYDNK